MTWSEPAVCFLFDDDRSLDYITYQDGQVTDAGLHPPGFAGAAWLDERRAAGAALWTYGAAGAYAGGNELQRWVRVLFPEWPGGSLASTAAAAGFSARGAAALLALYLACRERFFALTAETVGAVVPLLEMTESPLRPAWSHRLRELLEDEIGKKVSRVRPPGVAARPEPEAAVLTDSGEYFTGDGVLVRQWGMELRGPQERMANLVEQALNQDEFCAVEAGCGVGKSLAYGIPLFRWSALTREQVIISTHTRTLQQQLCERDFPFINKLVAAAGSGVTWFLLKGRENYLCPRRLRLRLRSLPEQRSAVLLLAALLVWQQFTERGDLDELAVLAHTEHKRLRRALVAADDGCLGKRCPWRQRCYFRQARAAARQADIVLVNHALLLSLLQAEAYAELPLLPPATRLVIDEAHNLERVAADQFGVGIAWWALARFCQRLGAGEKLGEGMLTEAARAFPVADPAQRLVTEARAQAAVVWEQGRRFFQQLSSDLFAADTAASRLRLLSSVPPGYPLLTAERLQLALTELRRTMGRLLAKVKERDDEWVGDLENWLRNFAEWTASFELLATRGNDAYVYWAERRRDQVVLIAAPRSVADALREYVYSRMKTIIFTSATLTIGERFDFWVEQSGLTDYQSLVTEKLPEVFDYDRQVRAGAVRFVPDANSPEYAAAVARVVAAAAAAAAGGVLALFTSFAVLHKVADELAGDPVAARLLVQGRDGSREHILERFREEHDSVLLGTASFWEGIDVPGAALETVIMVKLPFPVPDDPLVEAHSEDLAAAGREPFSEYQLPLMALRLRQGYGRLIRTRDDRGFFLLLDDRGFTRWYRTVVSDVLPHSEWVALEDISQLPGFFAGTELVALAEYDPELEGRWQRLRHLRTRLAREEAVKPYEVFPDRTLKALALANPSSLEEMLRVSGIREKKLAKYGELFLRELRHVTDEQFDGA